MSPEDRKRRINKRKQRILKRKNVWYCEQNETLIKLMLLEKVLGFFKYAAYILYDSSPFWTHNLCCNFSLI